MDKVLYYLIILFVIFLILYIFEYFIKAKKDALGANKSYDYIVRKYKLHMTKDRKKLLSKIVIVDNSLILSIPVYLVLTTDINIYLLVGISFIAFMILLILTYNFIGSLLKKKGW